MAPAIIIAHLGFVDEAFEMGIVAQLGKGVREQKMRAMGVRTHDVVRPAGLCRSRALRIQK